MVKLLCPLDQGLGLDTNSRGLVLSLGLTLRVWAFVADLGVVHPVLVLNLTFRHRELTDRAITRYMKLTA